MANILPTTKKKYFFCQNVIFSHYSILATSRKSTIYIFEARILKRLSVKFLSNQKIRERTNIVNFCESCRWLKEAQCQVRTLLSLVVHVGVPLLAHFLKKIIFVFL